MGSYYKREPIQGLEYLVSILSTYDTSDPRDTINAFRNIAKETYISPTPSTFTPADIEMPPDLDYKRSLLDVYTGFIKWIYRETGCIDILCRRWAMAERKTQPGDYPPLSALPSWIQTVNDTHRSDRALGRRRHGDCFVDNEPPTVQQPSSVAHEESAGVGVKFHIAQQHLLPNAFTESSRRRSRSLSNSRLPTVTFSVNETVEHDPLEDSLNQRLSREKLRWATSNTSGPSTRDLQSGETTPKLPMPTINTIPSSESPPMRDSGYFSGLSVGSRPSSQPSSQPSSRPGSPVSAVSPVATERGRAGVPRKELKDSSIRVQGLRIGRVCWSTDPTTDGIVPASALLKLFGKKHIPEEIDSAPDKVGCTLVAERGSNGEQAPGLYQTACAYVLSNVTVNGYINTKELLSGDPPYMVKNFLKRVHEVIWDRCFIEVEAKGPELGAGKRLHGLAPNKARVGDIFCVLFGCTVPVLLQEYTDSQGEK